MQAAGTALRVSHVHHVPLWQPQEDHFVAEFDHVCLTRPPRSCHSQHQHANPGTL